MAKSMILYEQFCQLNQCCTYYRLLRYGFGNKQHCSRWNPFSSVYAAFKPNDWLVATTSAAWNLNQNNLRQMCFYWILRKWRWVKMKKMGSISIGWSREGWREICLPFVSSCVSIYHTFCLCPPPPPPFRQYSPHFHLFSRLWIHAWVIVMMMMTWWWRWWWRWWWWWWWWLIYVRESYSRNANTCNINFAISPLKS